jgi:class 3 adenylate cyclase/predicted ATPase
MPAGEDGPVRAPATAPVMPDPQMSGERRHLTIMFCDMVESTALAARLDPEDLSEIIGAVRHCVTDAVTAFGGYVALHIGDGGLVYFGYPQAHENDAEMAVRAGLQVIERVSRLTFVGGYRPAVRIGIATGLVVLADTIGPGSSRSFVTGETPNLAARLQNAARPNTVVIAASTRRLTAGLFDYRNLGRISVKGFSELVPVWEVLGPSSAESRFEALHPTMLTPMVGRQRELEALWRCWEGARAGRGRVVLVSGEAGIGKSRLIAMLLDHLVDVPHTRRRYFCSPHQLGSPLHPFIAQIERAAGFSRRDTPSQKLAKLERALDLERQRIEDVALIAELLSIPVDERYPKLHLAPKRRRDDTIDALVRQLELPARDNPGLVIFEDAQWIDPTSRELLEHAVTRVASLPILLVVTSRPEFRIEWRSEPHVTTIPLNPLPPPECVVLVENIAGKGKLPHDVVDEIVDRTDGVPLYLEELTKAVAESGASQEAAMTVIGQAPKTSFAVPATLHASLLERLDRLGPAKDIAQIGAAIGREFSFELIAAVAGRDQAKLEAALERLVNAGLLFRRSQAGSGEAASSAAASTVYLFKHALVQDAAYGTMLRGMRRTLHRKIMEVLEGTFGDIAAAQPELLAHHCAEAGLVEKAVGYWLKAGHQALARSAMVEAVLRLRQGLQLISLLPEGRSRHAQELDLQIALGRALMATQGYAVRATGETFDRARYLCDRLDNPSQLVSVLLGQWLHALLRAELASARGRAEEMLRLGTSRQDPIWELIGCRTSGVTSFPLGEFAATRQFLERGLAVYNPAHRATYTALMVDDAKVVMLMYLSWTLVYLGYLDQARLRRTEAMEEARSLSHAFTLTHALITMSFTELTMGAFASALQHVNELIPLTRELGSAYYDAVGVIFHGRCLAALGQVDEGLELMREGLAAYRGTSSVLYMPTFLTFLADAYGRAEKPDLGLKYLGEAAEIVETTQTRVDEAEMNRVRANLLMAAGDTEAAEGSFRTAIRIAERQQAKLWQLRAATDLARLRCDQGKRDEARDVLLPVYGWFTEGFDAPTLNDAKILLEAVN